MEALLEKWGFSTFIKAFQKCGITLEILPYLTADDCSTVFKSAIGDRFRFEKCLENYRLENNIITKESKNLKEIINATLNDNILPLIQRVSADITKQTIETETVVPKSTAKSNWLRVENIESSDLGSQTDDNSAGVTKKEMHHLIETNFREDDVIDGKFRDNQKRRILVTSTFRLLQSKKKKMNYGLMRNLTQYVKDLLPNEDADYYYRNKNGKRGGAFYNRRDYINKKLKVMTTEDSESCTPNSDFALESYSFDNTDTDIEDIIHKAEFDKESITREDWKMTHCRRLKMFHELRSSRKEIANAFKKWPSYMDNHVYVDIDFGIMFPNNEDSFQSKWVKFVLVVIPYIMRNVRKRETIDSLKSIDSKIKKMKTINNEKNLIFSNEENFCILKAIHALVPPTSNCKSKTKIWKFSLVNSVQYFMDSAKTILEYEEKRNEKINLNKEYGISTNIMLAEIKNSPNKEENYIVYFDSITYNFINILDAVECAFKAHFVFQIPFQVQCSEFWKLFQLTFFEDIPVDVYIRPFIRSLAEELKSD